MISRTRILHYLSNICFSDGATKKDIPTPFYSILHIFSITDIIQVTY